MTECARYQRLAIGGSSDDPSMALVGASPYIGDMSQHGLVLPAFPSKPDNRYLCVLCGLRLGYGVKGIIRHIRQLLTLGCELPMAGGAVLPVEVPVMAPTWHFVDGSVSWHIRRLDPTNDASFVHYNDVLPFAAPFTAQWDAQLPCILTRQMPDGINEYIPQFGGVPPGLDIANLATFRDMRYPYTQGNGQGDLGFEVTGPCILVFYASVKQTNPETRPKPTDPLPSLEGLVCEDRFILTHPNARYWRIGGSMIIDICNPEGGAEDAK